MGRFSFQIHELADSDSSAATSALNQLFPPQPGKTWYRTRGFKELAYVHGTTEGSYRKTSDWLNRVRHQPKATSARTLQDNTEAEGQRIRKHLERKSEEILTAHQFSAEGIPLAPEPKDTKAQEKSLSEGTIEKVFHTSQIPEALRSKMKANPVPYENPTQSINISVDDVGVKEQKKQRRPAEKTASTSEKQERHHTYQTVVHIENQFDTYVFNTLGTVAAMPILITFLFYNQLLGGKLQFFIDGQRGSID